MNKYIAKITVGVSLWYVLRWIFLWNTDFNPTAIRYITLAMAILTANQIFPDKN